MSKSNNVRRTVDDFKRVICNFIKEEPQQTNSFSSRFASERALKKLEVPDNLKKRERYSKCWGDWLSYDFGLQDLELCNDSVRRIRTFSFAYFGTRYIKITPKRVSLTNGSTYISTQGRGSIEDKFKILEWTCTKSNLESFTRICYEHRALKSISKKRIKAYCLSCNIPYHGLCKELFVKFSAFPKKKIGYEIFRYLFRAIVTIVPGSRFSTVPKNNEKDRPINMEPFGNQVVQRAIGIYFKEAILDQFGLDLDSLADEHRSQLSTKIATIDLSNASDSITIALIRKIFPTHVVDLLMSSRSEYVWDPVSNDIHYPLKISSMGNGFTFELMTYILLCLTRSFDENSSVFGDDIIVSDEHAVSVIDSLKGIGFVPNLSKTAYGTNPFRESCGANWHATEGYIFSVDLHYPMNICECIIFYNKVLCLYRKYGIFQELERSLRRVVPESLRGYDSKESFGPLSPIRYDDYFHISKSKSGLPKWSINHLKDLHHNHDDFVIVKSFKIKGKLSSKTTRDLYSSQIEKYFMYLYSGRVVDNLLVGKTQTAPVTYLVGPGYSASCNSIRNFVTEDKP